MITRYIKFILLIITFSSTAYILDGCVKKTSFNTPPSYFNEKEFTGLVALPKNGTNIILDYELNQPNGKNLKIISCDQVNALTENNIITHHYKLYRLLSINCYASEQFISGKHAIQSFFNYKSLLGIVSNMPATAFPDLGGDSLDLRQGKTLVEFEPFIKTTITSPTVVSTVLPDGTHINYVLLVRKDINQDGIEDLIFRLDWYISDSFGSGSTLIAITKNSKTDTIKILWRYN